MDLSKKYNFSYLLLFYGRGNYNNDFKKILELIGKTSSDQDVKLPMTVVLNHGKVVDYTYEFSKKELEFFVVKNELND